MKKFYLALCATMIVIATNAQILREQTSPQSIASQIPGFSQLSSINTVPISYTPPTLPSLTTPVDEDTTTEGNGVYDFGTIIPVNISLLDGNFTTTSAGKVWTVRISVPNALNIGLTFTQFNLSQTAEMYIYNDAKTILNNKIKKEHFTNSDTVSISSMKGNAIVVYVIEPNNFGSFQSTVTIGEVTGGYRDIQDVGVVDDRAQLRTSSIDCIPHVQCYSWHMTSARAVARISIRNGTTVALCTGTLINNEQNNGRAYLLTAFHCVDRNDDGTIDGAEIDALRQATFQFQFWRTQCNGSINNPFIQFNGAILRATNFSSDMVLLELINQPGIGDGVNYAGWNRQTSTSSNSQSYVIHHPSGREMRHTQTRFVRSFFLNSNYWQAGYSSGVVSPGSSGSALFNEYNQVIGQLKGGWSSCDFTDFSDRYGKFYQSWNNGNLQQWLSPNQNIQELSGLNLTEVPIIGNTEISCSSAQQYYVRGGLADGNYQWSVSSNLIIVSGQNTSSITVQGNQANSSDFSGTITCTLSTPNKGRMRTLAVSKTVTFPTTVVNGYYSYAGHTATFPLQQDADGTNEVYPGGTFVTITSPETLNATWSLIYGNPTSWNWNANYRQLYIDMPQDEFAIFRMTVTTSCGTATFDFSFYAWIGAEYLISPNPTNNNLNISIDEDKLAKQKITRLDGIGIREVEVLDKFGNVLHKKSGGKNIKQLSLNVSSLKTDIYLVRIFDGKSWTILQFIKQ